MCGISGVVRPTASHDQIAAQLDRMWPGISSRGPDGRGQLISHGVGLLNSRLAIIDLGGGDQPLWNEDRTVGCVFNGEIYNFVSLRESLRREGHSFTSEGDTEVLVHLYEDYGRDLVQHLHGMYAFAIHDTRKRRLLLGRDRVGIKPLYLAQLPGGIAFASSIASLLALDVSSDPDFAAIAEYFRFYKIPEPHTAYLAISTLLPGHVLDIDTRTGRGDTERFYSASNREKRSRGAFDDAAALAHGAMVRAVTSHVLTSDVEVGAFLSGGIDSSLVVAEAQRVVSRPLRTFSVTFAGADDRYDESRFAEDVAHRLGTIHETIRVESPPTDLVRHAIAAVHQPFAVASFLPLLALSKHAAQQVKVVLTGDGGDEIGFGYPWYRWMYYTTAGTRISSRRAVEVLLRPVERGLPGPQLRHLRRAAHFARGAVAGGAAASDIWRYHISGSEAVGMLRRDLRPGGDIRASPSELVWSSELGRREALRQADLEVLLRDEMLPKLDRAGMAYGLEGRVPLLDDEFMEAMLQVPTRAHMAHPEGKGLLRRWAAEAVPGADFDRPKHGFDVPIDMWLRGSLHADVDRLLLQPGRHGLVDYDAAQAMWGCMQAGIPGAGHTLYALLLAELWFEMFV